MPLTYEFATFVLNYSIQSLKMNQRYCIFSSNACGRHLFAAVFIFFLATIACAKEIHFVHVSDLHYGLFRNFRGEQHVPSYRVIQAMIDKINALPHDTFPDDGGIGACKQIDYINFIVNTGDISSRMENGVQSAADSWAQYLDDWTRRLVLKDNEGKPVPVWLIPGNHDVSNAIGFHCPMSPTTDATVMTGIYNLMMHPFVPKTNTTFNYMSHCIRYSFTSDGIHYIFAGIWPDTDTRKWIAQDIDTLPGRTPVIIFAHDPPKGVTKHFTNPYGNHDIDTKYKFENLLADVAQESNTKQKAKSECRQLKSFIKDHPSIKAYFHGHTNYNEFYWWRDGVSPLLPVFRVDSPMKGEQSADDEHLLSFIFVTIDTDKMKLTAREYLWNNDGKHWGTSTTISLK